MCCQCPCVCGKVEEVQGSLSVILSPYVEVSPWTNGIFRFTMQSITLQLLFKTMLCCRKDRFWTYPLQFKDSSRENRWMYTKCVVKQNESIRISTEMDKSGHCTVEWILNCITTQPGAGALTQWIVHSGVDFERCWCSRPRVAGGGRVITGFVAPNPILQVELGGVATS